MGIINKNLGKSQRREVIQNEWSALANGSTIVAAVVPYPSILEVVQMYGFGLSGAPTVQVIVNRFIPGTGFTAFNLGSTMALPAFGTSGVLSLTMGFSLPQIGSTLTLLLVNDVVMIQTGGGSSAAVTGLCGAVVLEPIQDAKNQFGVI